MNIVQVQILTSARLRVTHGATSNIMASLFEKNVLMIVEIGTNATDKMRETDLEMI